MSRSPSGSFVLRLWISVGSGLLLLGAFVVHSVFESFQLHEERGRIEVVGATRALRSDLDGVFARIDLALRVVGGEHDRASAAGRADPAALNLVAANVTATHPDIEAIRVVDATGRVLAASHAPKGDRAGDAPAGGNRFPERLTGDPSERVLLSEPYTSPADGRRMIEVAHRLERADGALAGVVTGEIAVERLAKLLGAVVTGPHDEASLYSHSLVLLARSSGPDPASARGALVPVGLAKRLAEGQGAGTLVDNSQVDGRERVMAYHRLAAHGLVVTFARARSEELAHFRRDAVLTFAESAVLAALAIGMTVMIHRSWRQREHASRELERLARTDALTGLANRRRLFELAETELARAVRYGSPLSVLMIDIDHFKDVNDAFGHAAGDLVLRQLSETCRAVLRLVDTVGRVGGEEFAVLLPETTLAGAVEVAERLRSAVEAARVPREDGEPVAITVSIGVATCEPGKDVDALMSQSDTALYEAKRAGRNRVVACGEPSGG